MTYAPPTAQEPQTTFVLRAYRAWAVFMAVVYVALAGAFGFFLPAPHPVLYAGAAIAFAALYAAAALAPREPWAWTLGLVAIVVGMTGIGIVFAIPLLMAWRRPSTKAAYRRLP